LVETRLGFPRLDYFEVASTLDIAREQARRGMPHGTLITAAHQTSGRGRRGARWEDETGASALLTYILRPNTPLDEQWRVPFAASLACARFLQPIGASVKWPNDLIVSGGKIGGILVEAADDGALLLGIGINVAQTAFPASAQYVFPPISLRMVSEGAGLPGTMNATDVASGISQALDQVWNREWVDSVVLIRAWRSFQAMGHAQMGIDLLTDERVTGVYRDVREIDGAALIELPNAGQDELTAIWPDAAPRG
jgi:biotin-[acetyl-CoA-carboxylase] ligase BirA-like protein